VQAVIETATFLAKCKKFGISDAGREAIGDYIAQNPNSRYSRTLTGKG